MPVVDLLELSFQSSSVHGGTQPCKLVSTSLPLLNILTFLSPAPETCMNADKFEAAVPDIIKAMTLCEADQKLLEKVGVSTSLPKHYLT